MRIKKKTIIIFSLLLFSSFSSFFLKEGLKSNLIVENKFEDVKPPKIAYFNNSMEPISIDDSLTGVGAHNWSWASNKPWCDGTGDWNDPYVIENLTINAHNSGSPIKIKDSNKYFRIKNCTVFNSEKMYYEAGIYLDNVSNGLLIRNKLYNNSDGIYLIDCSNNSISRNTITNNTNDGIELLNSNKINISRNILFNNSNYGIIMGDSTYNNITRNTIFNNSYDGIYMYANNHYNNISRNTVNNSQSGITIISSNYNNASRNTVNDNIHGILLQNSHHNNISRNVVNNNTIMGISLEVDSNFNNVSWNEARYNGNYGIYLYNCNNNTISNNWVTKNGGGAIFEDPTCIINFIKDNVDSYIFYVEPFVIDDTGYGDYTWAQASTREWWCSGNGSFSNPYVIKNVTVNGHNSENGIEIINSIVYFRIENCHIYNCNLVDEYTGGIKLYSAGNGTLISNDFSNNGNNGIILSLSNNITISNNAIDNNGGDGIFLSNSNNNNITGNILNKNQKHGIHIMDSINNTLLENIMRDCGVYIEDGNEGCGDIKKFSHIIDTSNKVNNKILYYYINETNLGIVNFSNVGQIILVNVNDSFISNLNVSHSSVGLLLAFCNNVTLFNNTALYNNLFGLYLTNSNNNNLSDNIANYNDDYGIVISNCFNISLTGNNMTECGFLLKPVGPFEAFISHTIDSTNHVNDKHLYYYRNKNFLNPINFTDAGQLILINCSNSLISNLDLSHGSIGIMLVRSKNNTILNITSSYNTNYGILLYGLNNNNTISENILTNNGVYGIWLCFSCNENNITKNVINNNDRIGIYLDLGCISNNLYYNDLISNGINAKDGSSLNFWDDGEIGNHWGDYSGLDLNNDYIGDSNYTISGDGKNNDTRPLMYPLFADTDSDGLLNLEEYILGNDGYQTNISNPDSDYDGLSDYWESYYGTDPWKGDTDGDNMPDLWETQNSLDANYPNAMDDADSDSLRNLYEYLNGTNPQNPDTDYDLISDYDEILGTFGYITNATNPDTDTDMLLDGYEYGNYTNPLDPDTDDDFISDFDEINGTLGYITSPIKNDTDGDKLRDDLEYFYTTNPLISDTDGDNFNDYDEIMIYHTNAKDTSWYPMPNLFVVSFSASDVYEGQSFVLNFTISNNGIWRAEGIIVIIRCESLDLTLYNNTDSPFNLSIDQSRNFLIDCSAIKKVGSYVLTLEIDPDNHINERYSAKDGGLRSDWDENTKQIEMRIIAVSEGNGDLITIIIIIGSIIGGGSIGAVGIFFVAKPKIKMMKYSKKQKLTASLELENFENKFRDFLSRKLQDYYDYEWWEKGIPENIRIKIERQIKAESKFLPKMKAQFIKFLGLNHFYPIISEKNNWDEIFSEIFPDKNALRENFENLIEFKNKLSQNVATTEEINNFPLFIHSIMNFITKGFNIFLSYSTKDSDHFHIPIIVNRLKEYPNIENVLYWEADSGEDIVKYMERSLRMSKVFILFCSEKSGKSKAVEDEWEASFQLRKKGLMKIIPVYDDEKDIPYLLSPLLNVKYDEDDFDGFIEKLYDEIMRK